jgi:prepilin-type N-terminal cleavage/methylation domain-containing protein
MAKHATRRRQTGRGFTLIEVMIVVGIIVILAGIGLAVGLGVKRQSSDQVTKTTLKALDMAMGAFLKDHPEPKDLPPDDKNWLKGLQLTGQLPKSLKTSATGVQDGYGNDIHYIPAFSKPSTIKGWTAKPTGFFWSYGPDGAAGGDDDIFSEGASAQ